MPSNSPMPDRTDPKGCLYVVATPIGNLEDITLRALKVLAEVDLIAAEDTRHTRRLLAAHGIRAKLVSCHEHNEDRRTPELLQRLAQGDRIALVSDAGTPTVSDPGYRLVEAAAAQEIPVVPVPGVCAAVTALSAAGLATDRFTFVGFPARRKARRTEQLEALAGLPHTLIFYQSPHRLKAFVGELITVLGDRPAVLARELTKLHEEYIRCPLSLMAHRLEAKDRIRGECTLLVAGALDSPAEETDLQDALRSLLKDPDQTVSRAARELARQFNLPRKTVYAEALKIRKKPS